MMAMSFALKCPNPSCAFLFDPTKVPPGAVLTCPRCTMRFTLSPAGDSPPPHDSVADPALDFKAPVPGAPSVTEDEPPAAMSFLHSRAMIIIGLAACALVLFGVVALLVTGAGAPGPSNSNLKRFRDINFAITIADDWIADAPVRTGMSANVLAVRHGESTACIAIAATNFQSRVPPPGELRDGLTAERIHAYFDDAEITMAESTWLGQPAQKATFRARGKNGEGVFVGEAYAVAHNSYAYWFIAWASEAEWSTDQGEIEVIRADAKLINPNAIWAATESGIVILTGDDFTLSDGDGWWSQRPDPTGEDPQAVMLLLGVFKSKIRMDVPPRATAVVFMLDAADDPAGRFRGYIKNRYAKLFSLEKWNAVNGDITGDPPLAGDATIPMVERWHAESIIDPRTSKLVILHAIPGADGKLFGIEAACPWSDRSRWEKRLTQLAGSLKRKS
jgi:hypothetical protein